MRTNIATLSSLLIALTAGCQKPPEPAPEEQKQEGPAPSEAPAPAAAKADTSGPIKVGILHSLSGTMAISETSLKDVALMTIEEINQRAACSAASSSRWWSTRRRTGRCSRRRRAS